MRNRQMLPIMTILPIFQIILLSFAANYEVKNLNLAVLDRDMSQSSRQLTARFEGAGFFRLQAPVFSEREADNLLNKEKADLVLFIPAGFEKDLLSGNKGALQLQINAMNNVKASMSNFYAGSIIAGFNQDLRLRAGAQSVQNSPYTLIEPVPNNWYNPTLNYKTLMVPGILAEILSLLIIVLCALNIVREKEIGTMEQLNVTPVRKYQFILGKLIPFWIIGHVIFWLGLLAGVWIFDIPVLGNLWLLEAFIAVYLLVPLGIGFLISTTADTQQQALFVSFFFIMIFILMCGLFTPAENMPRWATIINVANPVKYIVEVNRLLLLKGTGIQVVGPLIAWMAGYAVLVNLLAVWRYKKKAA